MFFRQKESDNVYNDTNKNIESLISNEEISKINKKYFGIDDDKKTGFLYWFNFFVKERKLDPLAVVLFLFSGIFIYIYFASEFFCQVLGLFYPIYYLYALLNMPQDIQTNIKIKLVMKYFVMYGHLEFISSMLKIIGLYLSHMKIIVIIFLLYLVGYNKSMLDYFYDKTLCYNKLTIKLFTNISGIVKNEYSKINNNIKNI